MSRFLLCAVVLSLCVLALAQVSEPCETKRELRLPLTWAPGTAPGQGFDPGQVRNLTFGGPEQQPPDGGALFQAYGVSLWEETYVLGDEVLSSTSSVVRFRFVEQNDGGSVPYPVPTGWSEATGTDDRNAEAVALQLTLDQLLAVGLPAASYITVQNACLPTTVGSVGPIPTPTTPTPASGSPTPRSAAVRQQSPLAVLSAVLVLACSMLVVVVAW